MFSKVIANIMKILHNVWNPWHNIHDLLKKCQNELYKWEWICLWDKKNQSLKNHPCYFETLQTFLFLSIPECHHIISSITSTTIRLFLSQKVIKVRLARKKLFQLTLNLRTFVTGNPKRENSFFQTWVHFILYKMLFFCLQQGLICLEIKEVKY